MKSPDNNQIELYALGALNELKPDLLSLARDLKLRIQRYEMEHPRERVGEITLERFTNRGETLCGVLVKTREFK